MFHQNWNTETRQSEASRGKRWQGIRNGESVSSDFFQISLQHWLFKLVFLWLHLFPFSMTTSEPLLSCLSNCPSCFSSILFFSFCIFTFVFRSQRDTAVQHTVVLVQFVAWPPVMQEPRRSGPLAVQKALPDEHRTPRPPQEPSRTVSTPTPPLHPPLNFSHYFFLFCFVSSWVEVGVIWVGRFLITFHQVLRNTDKLWTLGKSTKSGMTSFQSQL